MSTTQDIATVRDEAWVARMLMAPKRKRSVDRQMVNQDVIRNLTQAFDADADEDDYGFAEMEIVDEEGEEHNI